MNLRNLGTRTADIVDTRWLHFEELVKNNAG